MAKNLYIVANEAQSGKSLVTLGVMDMLTRHGLNVGFFRPIINDVDPEQPDKDLLLIRTRYNIEVPYRDCYGFTLQEVKEMASRDLDGELLAGILQRYQALADQFDFILCEGSDFQEMSSIFEFDINAEIANHLSSPVLLVFNGHNKTTKEIASSIQLIYELFEDKRSNVVATIINRVTSESSDELKQGVAERVEKAGQLIFTLPETAILRQASIGEIAAQLNAEVLFGQDKLNRLVAGYTVAAMKLPHFLDRYEEGDLVITPGDRSDIIIGCLGALQSHTFPRIAGLVLTVGYHPEESILRLIQGLNPSIPIMTVPDNTFETAVKLKSVGAAITPQDKRKIHAALQLFEENVDSETLFQTVTEKRASVITPMLFEYKLIQRAKGHKKHIVLPEGIEPRILKAAEILCRRGAVDLTLLGSEDRISKLMTKHALTLKGVKIIDPANSEYLEDFIETYYELRKHKGITMDNARDVMPDVSYFGTMMVYKGMADGMVSGSIHTTAHTIRPSFEFIKTKANVATVSSVFFMCLPDKVLVYGDCAIVPSPTVEQLAEIAVSSGETAQAFNIEPRIALLSYSTGDSGSGEEVEKVRAATALAKRKAPHLLIEGPIQYDAAVDPSVAKTKMPNSEVAGKATVYIFPDLNTGNNTYKAVQRSAGAVAIGPVLQGLRKPVNDLSRGCTVADIVNTVAITAIQAQALDS
ncbi:MAG: phosphate acetyltransferase [Planctomycetota bacterium]|nr:phosphate acetyltransferase [Planctomycetota bacterium]